MRVRAAVILASTLGPVVQPAWAAVPPMELRADERPCIAAIGTDSPGRTLTPVDGCRREPERPPPQVAPRLLNQAMPGEAEELVPDDEEEDDDEDGGEEDDEDEDGKGDDATPDDDEDEETTPDEVVGASSSRHHFEAAISFGLGYETNPDNVAKLGGRSRPPDAGQAGGGDDEEGDEEDDDDDKGDEDGGDEDEDEEDDDDEETRQDDFSATLGIDLTHRYDLDTAAGTELRSDLSLEAARYLDLTDNNYTSLELVSGPEFQLDEDRDSTLRPFIAGSLLGLGSEVLSRSLGIGLESDVQWTPKLNANAEFSALFEHYEDTEDEPTGSDQTGWLYAGSVAADYQLTESTTLSAGLIGNFKQAAEDFEQYYELGFSLGLEQSLPNPLDADLDPVSLSFEVEYLYRPYDDSDPDEDIAKAERDRQLDADVVVTLPFRPRWSAVLRLSYSDNQSNYPEEEFENFGVLIGVAYNFDQDDA
jgi:hypothetical protein